MKRIRNIESNSYGQLGDGTTTSLKRIINIESICYHDENPVRPCESLKRIRNIEKLRLKLIKTIQIF